LCPEKIVILIIVETMRQIKVEGQEKGGRKRGDEVVFLKDYKF